MRFLGMSHARTIGATLRRQTNLFGCILRRRKMLRELSIESSYNGCHLIDVTDG